MILLDTRTILIVIAISCLIMSVALFIAHIGRSRRDGTHLWTAGCFVQFVSWSLFSARWLIPDFFSIAVGYTLQTAGYSLIYAAVRQFQGRPCRRRILILPVIVSFVLSLVFLDLQVIRVALSGAIFSIHVGAIAWMLFRDTPEHQRRSQWLTGSAFFMASLLWFSRFLEAFINPSGQLSLLAVSVGRTAGLIAGFSIVILSSFGFMNMTRERADQENERLATLDPLMEIFNRRTFLDLARREIARHRRNRAPLALLMLDIDNFKRINDTYGHQTGDDVLKAMAAVTLTCLRRNDLFGRYGGEEFAILLSETDGNGAAFFAERLRSRIAGISIQIDQAMVGWTVSIGLTSLNAGDAADLDALLRTADEALYAAKAKGKNCVVQFSLQGQGQKMDRSDSSPGLIQKGIDIPEEGW
jgi:diguanylate cyclase (GGDEF)-like protein